MKPTSDNFAKPGIYSANPNSYITTYLFVRFCLAREIPKSSSAAARIAPHLFISMEVEVNEDMQRDDIIFYSVLYSSVTVVFGMAVLSKFLTNEFRFGFRSFLSLVVLFLGEPLCQFFIKGPGGLVVFAVGCLLVYSILPASHLPVGNKAVLITGMLLQFWTCKFIML